MEKQNVREITVNQLVNTIYECARNETRFCFILGAGASRSSGIKTGIDMTREWLEDIRRDYTEPEIKAQMSKLKIKNIEPKSENYFDIYDLRFHTHYRSGYAYLEKAMEKAQPSFGYYHLASMLASTESNLVITTNFDSLTEDALFIYTDKRPIAVSHELLADYININTKRPIIAKINRGVFFGPRNRKAELQRLSAKWKKVLGTVFQIYTPIVLGYAGGDDSLMSYLSDPEVTMNGLYWCYHSPDPPSEKIQALVESKEGFLIPIDGFDEMMFLLGEKFGHQSPVGRIKSVADKRVRLYEEDYSRFFKKYKSIQNPTEAETQVLATLEDADARAVADLTEKLESEPVNATLYFRRANAYSRLGEYGKAVEDFDRALEEDPVLNMAYYNRGNAYSELELYEKAIEDYSRVLLAVPDDTDALINRADAYFMLGDYERSIEDLTEAIRIEPNEAIAFNNRGYAYFKQGKMDEALADYNRALVVDPGEAITYTSLGEYYFSMSKYEPVISYSGKAIELDPSDGEPYYWRGKAYEAMGRSAEAVEDLAKAEEYGFVPG